MKNKVHILYWSVIIILFYLIFLQSFRHFTFSIQNQHLLNILLSQTSTIATLVAGAIAFFVYKNSKEDEADTAARILFLEIKQSEIEIKKLIDHKIRTAGGTYSYADIVKLIQNKAWTKYSHLFTDKLNNDEYSQLSEYFKKCDVLEKYFEKQHNFFWITTEERARQIEQISSKLAYDHPDLGEAEYLFTLNKILDLSAKNPTIYSPNGITLEINKQLESITLPSLTPIWDKLKDLAKIE